METTLTKWSNITSNKSHEHHMPPNVMQLELNTISYVVFLPKLSNLFISYLLLCKNSPKPSSFNE